MVIRTRGLKRGVSMKAEFHIQNGRNDPTDTSQGRNDLDHWILPQNDAGNQR